MPNMFDDNPKYIQFDSEIINYAKNFMQQQPSTKWMQDDLSTISIMMFERKFGEMDTDEAWHDWNTSKVVMPAWDRCTKQAAEELGILEQWEKEAKGFSSFEDAHDLDKDYVVLLPDKNDPGTLHAVNIEALLSGWSDKELSDKSKIQIEPAFGAKEDIDDFFKAFGDDLKGNLGLGDDFPPIDLE